MPQIDFDGANSLVKTDKIQGQGGTTVTVPTGHTVAITDAGGLTLAGTAVNAGALGKVVQVVNTTTGASATGTTTMPHDDTIPQNSEGTEYMTLAITPTSSSNKLLIEWVANIATSAPMQMTTALFQDSTSNALAVLLEYNSNTNAGVVMSGKHYMAAGTTSSTTFKLRCASQNAATMTFNGYSGSRLYGGALASSITITEIAV